MWCLMEFITGFVLEHVTEQISDHILATINKPTLNQLTADVLFHNEGNTLEQIKKKGSLAKRTELPDAAVALNLFVRFYSEKKPASFTISAER